MRWTLPFSVITVSLEEFYCHSLPKSPVHDRPSGYSVEAAERQAGGLIALPGKEHSISRRGRELVVEVNQDQLARSPASRQAVNRNLRALERDNLIERRYGLLVIKDANRLNSELE